MELSSFLVFSSYFSDFSASSCPSVSFRRLRGTKPENTVRRRGTRRNASAHLRDGLADDEQTHSLPRLFSGKARLKDFLALFFGNRRPVVSDRKEPASQILAQNQLNRRLSPAGCSAPIVASSALSMRLASTRQISHAGISGHPTWRRWTASAPRRRCSASTTFA